ncbi:MAG: 50S ribosomal protein L13 [Patescibacteria group bacterium]
MNKEVKRQLHKIDATGKAVGRLASQVAIILRGKNKPEFTRNLDLGDIVEVTNIDKLKFSGKKLEQKKYFHYSGYQGGLKEKKMSQLVKENPAEILNRAVREMLPANRLRRDMLKRLIIR